MGYTRVIDLTARARRIEKEREARDQFPAPDPSLPLATPDTLPSPLRTALDATGWTALMPVQAQAIPYLLDGRDLIVQSRTGSGKTGAFLLPLFDTLDASLPHNQALILAPTRELARQIHAEFEGMNVEKKYSSALVYGGVSYKPQLRRLGAGAHLVVGTPGRVLDHLSHKTFTLDHLSVLVLDEADEMLSMGFLPAMQQLRTYLPEARRSSMFSATMPPKVRELGRLFLSKPSFLGLSEDRIGVDKIRHCYYRPKFRDKAGSLIRILEMLNPPTAIIFANTRREVHFLAALLGNYGFLSAGISGDRSQAARERAMKQLHNGRLRILIATDVAARGIDIDDLSHVIQYDVPQHMEMYIHRTGRTARAGRDGTAVTLATFEEESRLHAIARYYAIDMEKRPVPTEEDVAERATERVTKSLEGAFKGKNGLERERLERFVPVVQSLASESPELLAMLVDELYQRQTHGPRQDPSEKRAGPRQKRSRRRKR